MAPVARAAAAWQAAGEQGCVEGVRRVVLLRMRRCAR